MLRLAVPPPLARLAVALALAGPLAACRPALRAPAPVTVLVYNVHAGKDAVGVDNLASVGALVRRSGADVALLQEVDVRTRRSGGVDQPAVLARATGFRPAFGRTLAYDGGLYGVAVLSRWPVRRAWMRPLPVPTAPPRAGGSHEPRGALVAVLEAPGGPLTVVNTHLDASGDPVIRAQEMATLTALVDSLRRAGHARLVVGGDFNSRPDAPPHAAATAAGWRDAWAACGPASDPGFTFNARRPDRRIDYLWLTGALGCARAEVLPDTASDHRALLVRGVR